jgi:hypothetical protein
MADAGDSKALALSAQSKDLGANVAVQRRSAQHDLVKKNAHLFLGNTKTHPRSFMIVGLYYPPRVAQLGLF